MTYSIIDYLININFQMQFSWEMSRTKKLFLNTYGEFFKKEKAENSKGELVKI